MSFPPRNLREGFNMHTGQETGHEEGDQNQEVNFRGLLPQSRKYNIKLLMTRKRNNELVFL